ncbi:T9SS type B sorting domain-containing protein [Flavilitoribacter nigricans]|uniref:Ig-like domain-containing protein n=1 Tax=Flavilitoribacter nigricans (strain ATCC 23147 / DSM 23189 / NBRC 102662 / NCIMB 1420 / SS-2) TaxID=1122177 RepID=A0A2D0N4Q6_FLAN2|nr:gliding motility-associated C-terminal domain-containing protein [Flavilitoribacter nigricans]PHN03370.1 hypothetical protein CRP01_27180 [Flavilitoribacter nigricans DSM 23189 = NBRC 102662]
MMRSTFIALSILSIVCLSVFRMSAQTGLVLQVDSATIDLTCGDLFGNPEPMWGVQVNGQPYQYYPQNGACFSPLPNQQYIETVSCPADLPTEIEVCFHGFENDPLIPAPASCEINPDCEATICQNFTVPAPGQPQSLSLALPAGGDVTGTLNFTMAVESLNPPATNDLICDAIDLGTVRFNNSIGNLINPVYNNYCATNVDEPNPFDVVAAGVFINDRGVWFSFTTDSVASNILLIDVRSDPLNTGDEFDAQAALYEFPGGDCTATPTLLATNSDNSSFNVQLRPTCIQPNTRYYLLVDGGTFGNESIEGPFSLRIIDPGVQEGGDLRCDFEDLGVVPENGIVETDGFRSNLCASDFADPYVSAFVSQHSVWYSFIAPASGHVRIDALSDQLIQPLDAQLAVYQAVSGVCNGGLRHIKSQYQPGDYDESMEVSCLFGGRRYFILVDGSGYQARGIFKLSVSDAGDITPVVQVDTMICAGESIRVGFKTYDTSGNYIDTLRVREGCDSIVYTNLTVAEPLSIDFQQTRYAFGEGMADAEARVTVSGGIGTPTITWCDGQTGDTATGLIGGSQCCVSVVDSIGCQYEACFEIEYITGVSPIYQDTSVACFGDENGVITLSAARGLPPYTFDWSSADGALSGNGVIDTNFQEIRIADLPAGAYTFTIRDSYRDSTFTVNVNEPPQLQARLLDQQEITCTGDCSGSLTVEVTGGTPPYDLSWNDGARSEQLQDLCAGTYTLTVTDANGCETTLSATLEEPLPFTATAELLQEVSCYQGSNGQVGVRIENGKAADYFWSNGATTSSQSGLPAGFYQLTVTSDLFCESVTEIEITEPAAPLELEIRQIAPVSCGGETDGQLQALVEGPYQDLYYQWSNGATTSGINQLGAGTYTLQIRNERDCITSDTFQLEEPPVITASLSTRDISCLDAPESGIIYVDEVNGGLGDYLFSVDGDRFFRTPAISNLPGGDYVLIVQDGGGCEQQFPVTIQTPPELTVSLGSETIELDLGDSIELAALSSSANVLYQWDHDNTLAGSNTTVSPQISSYYRVRVEDTETLCRAEAVVFVQVNKRRRVYIPNAFSPNMDGNNDYFFIYGDNDIVAIESLRVFSRDGHLVYQDNDLLPNDPIRSWDGTLNGQDLSSGVYVYVAQIRFVDGQTEVFQGDVALIR